MEIQQNIPLAPFTTLKIGGPATHFACARSEAQLIDAITHARKHSLPIFVLGGGSNLVVADTGFAGLVLQVAIQADTAIQPVQGTASARFHVAAGTGWDAFVAHACAHGYAGVECLAGIPGLVGGSPVQNIGAYGQEVAQTVVAVRAFDLHEDRIVTLPAAECGFAYRRSIFNSTHPGHYIVTQVTFELDRDSAPNLTYADLQKYFAGHASPSLMEVYDGVRAVRRNKGMLIDTDSSIPDPDQRSAGSFFKNPVVTTKKVKAILETLPPDATMPQWPTETGGIKLAAAWLIEQAGFPKGYVMGRVGISSRHTLALINRSGDATCADLLRLRDLIQTTVEDRFGVSLEQEPILLG